ncbi:MAG: ABC transporter ATP-binding protein/permease [Lachnospiraceae bacterium]|nr:ABC transporter ATP-binding protein/permease [Lachnospiraceae bacterium]
MNRFLPYYKPYVGTLLLDLFCAALTTGCDLVLPMIMRQITSTGMNDPAMLTMHLILRMTALYFVLKLVECGASYYMADMGHVMGAEIETDMRRDSYDHLMKLSDRYYNNTKVGQIMGRITNDLFDVTEFAHHCPEEFFIAGIKALGAFIVLGSINLPLTIIIFLMIPIMMVVCISINQWQRAAFRRQRFYIGELNARIEDSLLGQKVVKAFANEAIEKEKFEKDNVTFLGIKAKTYRYMGIFQTSIRLFDGLMYLAVVLAGGIFLVKGGIAAPDLVAYVLYVSTLIATIRRIVEFAEQFQRGMTGIERFLQIMDADIDIFDRDGAREMQNPKGEIVFEDATFEYMDDHNEVFEHLNLSIHPGEKVALVGPSGSGKTTMCNLIPRFYDLTGGKVTIDGVDVRDYTLQSLRRNIGIVQQDVYLFSGTVFENIVYGRPGATREEVVEAAKKAGAHEFISALKDGYDTYVGERGVKLSGGQKQRISIARVFLKDPAIIILDEATSALDNESEFEVAKALNELAVGRTTLTVAHRLSTIRDANRIFVLTENGIEEEGTHEELLEKKGIYHRFYQMAERLK